MFLNKFLSVNVTIPIVKYVIFDKEDTGAAVLRQLSCREDRVKDIFTMVCNDQIFYIRKFLSYFSMVDI